ncbi:hypothetical protein DRE_00953 [Drechslerella stenobrocha 248]|uniref:Uncharacterized protein n=1 Tax=Drechslerella stenobrocha 248 TaxID=1043628 RepID=W7HP15_9PEZI|nr:hypothetical protein DRE_00953 [Drechslerella stenobrocha 248]
MVSTHGSRVSRNGEGLYQGNKTEEKGRTEEREPQLKKRNLPPFGDPLGLKAKGKRSRRRRRRRRGGKNAQAPPSANLAAHSDAWARAQVSLPDLTASPVAIEEYLHEPEVFVVSPRQRPIRGYFHLQNARGGRIPYPALADVDDLVAAPIEPESRYNSTGTTQIPYFLRGIFATRVSETLESDGESGMKADPDRCVEFQTLNHTSA